jgi:hypothetical protein
MIPLKHTSLIVLLTLSLVACNAQTTKNTAAVYEQNNGSSSIENNDRVDVDLSGISLPAAHIVSPTRYDYFLYIFENTKVFSSVGNGYIDEGLEIRVQRDVGFLNKEGATASLLLSASTVFLIPAYSSVEDVHNFSVYFDGKHIKDFEYRNIRGNIVSLFDLSGSFSDDEIMRKVDQFVVETFIREFYDSQALEMILTTPQHTALN